MKPEKFEEYAHDEAIFRGMIADGKMCVCGSTDFEDYEFKESRYMSAYTVRVCQHCFRQWNPK